MKLTSSEIKALASKITRELNEKLREEREIKVEQIKKEFYKTKSGKVYKSFIDEFGSNVSFYGLKTPWSNIPNKFISSVDVSNEIIIKAIEADGLDKLVGSITKYFLTKK